MFIGWNSYLETRSHCVNTSFIILSMIQHFELRRLLAQVSGFRIQAPRAEGGHDGGPERIVCRRLSDPVRDYHQRHRHDHHYRLLRCHHLPPEHRIGKFICTAGVCQAAAPVSAALHLYVLMGPPVRVTCRHEQLLQPKQQVLGRRLQKLDSANVCKEKGSLLSFVYIFVRVACQCC